MTRNSAVLPPPSPPIPLPDWQGWPAEAKVRLATILREHRQPQWNAHDARPEQLPPPDPWDVWAIVTGRGWGKTRTGAEWVWRLARDMPGSRGALIAPTAADVRDTMVEGESGVLAAAPPAFRPEYEPSKRRLTYPNGSIQTTFSADKPDRLRGPQHHYGWLDEPAAYPRLPDLLAMYRFGLRLGEHPRTLLTTTPRPVRALRELLREDGTVLITGTTRDNLANLSPEYQRQILARYDGTRLGRQEIEGQFLDDTEGALWTLAMIDATRVDRAPDDLAVVVVGVDPAVTSGPDSDETGIVVAARGGDGRYYVLADQSGRYTPLGWATVVRDLAAKHNADRVVAEANQGGDLVVENIRRLDSRVRIVSVHASRGKRVRAEPVAALYERGLVSHVGLFASMEDQLCTWTPLDAESPDRMDALVWALTSLSDRPPVGRAVGFRT